MLLLSRCLFEVVYWPATYLVYWISPVIDVVRANFDFTMGGGFWSENRFIHMRAAGSCSSFGSVSLDVQLNDILLEVLLHPSTCLVYWIGPVIDVVRANLDFTMENIVEIIWVSILSSK